MTAQKALNRLDIALTVALLVASIAIAIPARAEEPAGQKLFLENKCNMCHSIESLGIERTSTSDKMKAMDLSSVGDELDLDWAVKFIKKEVEREGELHQKTFKGSDEDAKTIADWLATLKSAQ
jgi:mono/diheme cytochrome c family protein